MTINAGGALDPAGKERRTLRLFLVSVSPVATLRAGEGVAKPISRADSALHRAKAEGRNRVVAEAPAEAS